ncbi:AAA family ATPase [Flavobacterium sp. GB2R13]|uniref:AAA family ATPase n=1 Tax=Flavobacterium algoris TaxID=3398733 RepID=UPI003A8BB010
MKIKKVQISGFRAFNKVENSTFNFELPDNTTADFISIYAPNGFGKTSFYDAVEWGVTHQIQRFDRMPDFNKSRKENNGDVLLNNVSSKGEVIVETTEGVFKNTINTRRVYNPKGIPDNAYFKEVILSQDLIDTFIKEEKAELRYDKFVEFNPEIKSYNNSLKNLTILFDFIESKTKELNTEIEKKQKNQLEIDFDEEGKKFDEINKALQFLKDKKEEIDLIEKDTFTQTKYDFLDQKIKSRIISLEIEIETGKLRIGNIDIVYNGIPDSTDDNNKGVFTYFDNRNKIVDLEKVKNDLNDVVTKIKYKENCELKDNKLKTQISEELELNKLYLLFKEKFKIYLTIENEINERNKIYNNYDSEKLKSEKQINDLNEINQKNVTDLDRLQKELIVKQTTLKNIPFQIERFATLNKNNEELTPQINVLNESISEKERLIEGIKLKLTQHHFFNHKIDTDIEVLIDSEEFKDNKDLITSIIAIENKINIAKEEIITINEKINLQNELNNELKDFVSKGLEIVSKNNSVDCPLCNHTYKSFNELSTKITENKLLGKIVKESLESKLKLENEINKFSDDLSVNKSILKEHLKKVIEPFEKDKLKNENELIRLAELKDEKIQELIKSENEIKEINQFFENNINLKDFEEKVSKEITVYEKEILEISNVTNTNKTTLNDQQNIIKSAIANKDIVLKSIAELKTVDDYNEVIKFYSNTLKTNEISLVILEETIENSNEYLDKLKNEVEENLKVFSEIDSKLLANTLTEEEAIKKYNEVDTAITLIKKNIQNFEQYIKSEFKIDLVSIDKNQVDIEFEKIKNFEKEKLQLLSSINENYMIVDKLKDDCLKVTEAEKNQKEIKDLYDEIGRLVIVKGKIINEKNNLKKYLEKTINSFFYKDLINKIYSKIDPHPDYSEIEFKCDFADKNPRLQIYTIKYIEGKRVESIPSLYFSTAQINILSLSIFLARALKTKNPQSGKFIDCIFIDDPIQSMDTINILSFIDLFRSMILFLGKQLIVSTHEENFHLLLQKKMPVELFNSKYIEFETFGKLKKHVTA